MTRGGRGRGSFRTAARMIAVGTLLAACNRGGPAPSAASSVMVVGPENVAIVREQTIRTGPAISGTLQPEEQATVRAEVGGAVLQTYAEQGERV
ncbi:MAG TPA: hypothetical protein VN650_17305, partial [Gemmatimonadaceae bacterium]|nr:hypothetical protein [Gemmatimonadaceae bacterium]